MALTRNLQRTGRAASMELADQRQYVRDAQDPNSSYWYAKANAALARLQDVVGDEEGRRQTLHIDGTWQSVFEQISLIADLAEKQKDNLPQTLPSAEEQEALERRLAELGDTCPACNGRGDEIVHGEIEGCAHCGGTGYVDDYRDLRETQESALDIGLQ